MRKRPNLYTNYSTENAIFSNSTQKFWFFVLTFLAVSLCFVATDYWILLISRSLTFAIGAWGINIVSGLAGQITLAHGSFIGIGVYTAAVLGGSASSSVIGLDLDMIIWLPAAGIVAALITKIIIQRPFPKVITSDSCMTNNDNFFIKQKFNFCFYIFNRNLTYWKM